MCRGPRPAVTVRHGASAYGHTKTLGVFGYHPAGGGARRHRRVDPRLWPAPCGRVRRSSAATCGSCLRPWPGHASPSTRRESPPCAADAGFFSYDLLDLIEARNASWSITIPQNAMVKRTAIAAIGDKAWKPIAYTRGGQAQVAETTIKTGPRSRSTEPRELRLVVRRTRLTGPQAELWPDWRHHCLVTNRADLDTETADTYHRAHARVELAIKTSKTTDWPTAPQGSSSPTAPGWPAPLWPTTPHAGSHASATRPTPQTTHRRGHRPQPAAHRARTSPPSTTQAATSCACPSTGPGPASSPQPSNTCATRPCSSKHPPRGPALRRFGPHPTRWTTRQRPTQPNPTQPPQPAAHPRTSRQPLRPRHPAPAPQLALGPRLHHSPPTPAQPAPAHLNPTPGTGTPSHTPTPPNPTQPNPTPTLTQHAPTHQTRRETPRPTPTRHQPAYHAPTNTESVDPG